MDEQNEGQGMDEQGVILDNLAHAINAAVALAALNVPSEVIARVIFVAGMEFGRKLGIDEVVASIVSNGPCDDPECPSCNPDPTTYGAYL